MERASQVFYWAVNSGRLARQGNVLAGEFLVAMLVVAIGNAAIGQETLVPDTKGYDQVARTLLSKYCVQCHGPDLQEGEFRIDRDLKNDFLDRSSSEKWEEVLNVLNGHEMPPQGEAQPAKELVSRSVDWITGQISRAELYRRDTAVVMRRLNRIEYQNTVRDLTGVPFDVSVFPQDASAGGFDNNGSALTLSPLQVELYYKAAREILDKALVHGKRPETIRWRFEVESGDSDSNRVPYGKNRIIVNGGRNSVDGDFKVLHHNNWDRTISIRDFVLPRAGMYTIRVRAASKVPQQSEVVTVASKYLKMRYDQRMKENPRGEPYFAAEVKDFTEHFRSDRMYRYGPARLKLGKSLLGQPIVIDEFDVPASINAPEIYEFQTEFNEYKTGISLEYAYKIPRNLENATFQTAEDFPRPEAWVDWVELEGPAFPQWPPASHKLILGEVPLGASASSEQARDIVKRFMQRAYRRPVTEDEVDAKMLIYDAARQQKDFIEAIKAPLATVLVSPHFLYFVEPGIGDGGQRPAGQVIYVKGAPLRKFRSTSGQTIEARLLAITSDHAKVQITRNDGRRFVIETSTLSPSDGEYIRKVAAEQKLSAPGPRELNGYELASRLSYFLWSTLPDGSLLAAAESGSLTRSEELHRQVDRMLKDEKSRGLAAGFAAQWLGLREVGANPPAADLYPRYDRHLEESIVEESLAFFMEVLNSDASLSSFLQSDFVVINERLARFYDIPGVRGDHFRRVSVPRDSPRGGVVTQASVLSITSNGTRTSPVKRGTWVLKNLLGQDPGLPLANAGDIAPRVPGIDKATVRKRLEIHRELPQCARCHNKIDPLGFALENFNAAGEYRTQEGFGYKGRIEKNDPPVDASAALPDGTQIDGSKGLQRAMLQRKDQFYHCLTEKMLTYALGRQLGVSDQRNVQAAVQRIQSSGNETLRNLIHTIVALEVFRTK